MIDFGMAVKYDHGVWFKDMATKKDATPLCNRGCFGKSGGFDGEKSLWNPRCKKLVATKEEGSEDTDGASLECVYHVAGVAQLYQFDMPGEV